MKKEKWIWRTLHEHYLIFRIMSNLFSLDLPRVKPILKQFIDVEFHLTSKNERFIDTFWETVVKLLFAIREFEIRRQLNVHFVSDASNQTEISLGSYSDPVSLKPLH